MKHRQLISILGAFTLFLLIQGCGRENVQTTMTGQDCELVDPLNDLVAFMDPIQHKLFVLPEQKENVLKRMGAEPVKNDIYAFQSLTVSGKYITSRFTIAPLNTAAEILLYVSEADKWLYDNYANRDTARGVFIKTFKDSSGTFYRVYKNAECKKVANAGESPCIKQVIFIFNPTPTDSPNGYYIPKETGKYVKFEYLEVNNCVKGTNYCVEALVVTRKKYFYNDVNCSQILEIIPEYGYSCIK
jgi:hypothetical protein